MVFVVVAVVVDVVANGFGVVVDRPELGPGLVALELRAEDRPAVGRGTADGVGEEAGGRTAQVRH